MDRRELQEVPMKLNSRIAKRVCQALLLPIFASLAGCGGGSDSGTQICLLFLIVPVPCSASSSPSPPPLPLPPPSTGTGGEGGSGSGGTGGGSGNRALIIRHFAEFEPNSTMDNANNVQFPPAPSDTSAVVEITGYNAGPDGFAYKLVVVD